MIDAKDAVVRALIESATMIDRLYFSAGVNLIQPNEEFCESGATLVCRAWADQRAAQFMDATKKCETQAVTMCRK